MVSIGCGKRVFIEQRIWAKNCYGKYPSEWYETVLANSEYKYCGHTPFGPDSGQTIVCYECAIKLGVIW